MKLTKVAPSVVDTSSCKILLHSCLTFYACIQEKTFVMLTHPGFCDTQNTLPSSKCPEIQMSLVVRKPVLGVSDQV